MRLPSQKISEFVMGGETPTVSIQANAAIDRGAVYMNTKADGLRRMMSITPWQATHAQAWDIRLSERFQGPAGEVNRFVEKLQTELSQHVPWIDPFCGGADATVLLVLKRPGPRGAMASQFLSLANDDRTAKNTIESMLKAGLRYTDLTFWNVVPWGGPREEVLTRTMRASGEEILLRMLPLLKNLRAVLLMGNEAHHFQTLFLGRSDVRVSCSPHTSPLVWNRAEKRRTILEAFQSVAQAIGRS